MAEKTSLPFLEQLGGIGLLGLFSPWGARAAENMKPQLFNHWFSGLGSDAMWGSGEGLPPEIAGIRRFLQPYNPWEYSSERPGGPSQAEQDLLNNSLFGLAAPLDLSAPRAMLNDYSTMFGAPNYVTGKGPAQQPMTNLNPQAGMQQGIQPGMGQGQQPQLGNLMNLLSAFLGR